MFTLQAKLATLEKRIIPSPSATPDVALQRALVKLTCKELKLLMGGAKLPEDGREGELTEEHPAASHRLDEFIAQERALACGRR